MNIERSEGHPAGVEPSKPDTGIAIIVTPFEDENVVFNKAPDGGYTIFLRGEIAIAVRPPAPSQAAESPVTTEEEQASSLAPESTPSPASEPHSGSEEPSQTASPAEEAQTPENENRKFELIGNPVRDPSYQERKSGKRIADFVLATHPSEETTEYYRIRAFDKQAERVRDQVRKGQKDVEATVYGPKRWKSRKKTKEGLWEETEVTGYYAGFVKVPKKYREQKG